MECYTKKYFELTSNEIKQIKKLIIKGGEVDSKTLSDRLSNTELITFFIENDKIISTASIKRPTNNYKSKIFIKSQTNENNDDFLFDLGYVSTDENYQDQKLTSNLCFELQELYVKYYIFPTTRIDNEPMKSILSKNNFKEIGNEFLNKKQTNYLKLHIKLKTDN